MRYDPEELTENDVLRALTAHLRDGGWVVERSATTAERGLDLVARGPAGWVLRVEAKGATSSKTHSARHGKPFNSAQVRNHVARAFFTAAASRQGNCVRSAMALPATPRHQALVEHVKVALGELDIGVFWVGGDDLVRLDATWEL